MSAIERFRQWLRQVFGGRKPPAPSPAPVPVPTPVPVPIPVPVPPPPVPPPPAPVPPPAPAGKLDFGVSQKNGPVDPVTKPIAGITRTITVGPNQEFPDLDKVPHRLVGPGWVINVQYRPEPYRDMFMIGGQGTAADPIIYNGVTDSQGRRPVLDFSNGRVAEGCSGMYATDWAGLGGILVMRPQGKDYNTYKPKHIRIQGFRIIGAAAGNRFTYGGQTKNWSSGSNIRIQLGEDVVIDNCELDGGDFNLFTQAKDSVASQMCSRIRFSNSRTKNGGKVGSWFEHNVYLQADDPRVYGNLIGKVKPGSEGSSFKDRSARLVFADNDVESSARAIDLVHSEDQQQGIASRPYYGKDYVYGNRIRASGPVYEPIHYGGDNQGEQDGSPAKFVPPMPYRQHLFFWDNDVELLTTGYRNIVFGLSTADTIADVWNNQFVFGFASTDRFWLEYAGRLRLFGNTVDGPVRRAGRDGSNAAHWTISDAQVPQDDFLAQLLRGQR